MAVREYKRICKQAGCGQEFIVSAPSIEEDRQIGLSEPEYCPKHRALHAKSYSRIACHHYEVELTLEGEQLVRQVEAQKILEGHASQDLRGRTFDPWALPAEGGYGPGGIGRFQRPLRAFVSNEDYQPERRPFQIEDKRDEILMALEDHQVIVIVGTTGSGKSTYVPWLLLTGGEPGHLSHWARQGPICVTQPRIQATRQVPRFIANVLNGTNLGVGAQIGFCHSNADEFDRRARLIFETDGKLINDIVSGVVSNYSIVIIDEAHERSANIDLILGLMRDQLYLYPHLRLIIASATIDFNAFLGFYYPQLKDRLTVLGDPEFLKHYTYFKQNRQIPFIYSEGRRHAIAQHWWGASHLQEGAVKEWDKKLPLEPLPDWWKKVNNGQLPTRDQFPQAIAELVQLLCRYLDSLQEEQKKHEDGHILVFLPGSREIDQTVSAIRALDLPDTVALPLYAQRPLDEQEAALKPDSKKHKDVYGKRRVVVSTNVAETSLTVEDVKYVIDSGYIKESYWNPATAVAELQTLRHSKAGCRQRWGRAGRVGPGHAFMLYTAKQFESIFPNDTTPALARSSLEQVLLTAKAAGVRSARSGGNLLDFEWMPLAKAEDNARLAEELRRAYKVLRSQDAIDEEGDLTRFGLEMRSMPAALDVARIFTEAELHSMGIEVATLLPFLRLDYGLQAVLLWKNEWDPYTKLQVRQQHLDLAHGCRDDLDLYLKLWMLWEAKTEKERQRWEDEGGINYKNFQDNIEAERRKLLGMAIDWRKAESRPISVGKLDAMRALISHCLPGEIYVPIEKAETRDRSTSLRRLEAGDTLAWEAYWEGADQYEEYDDELQVDPSYSTLLSNRSGVYQRYSAPAGEAGEGDLIEIVPTSVCFGKADAELLVACQRRANFRRPARAKVLGMNMIQVEPAWLETIRHGTVVERAQLYASLSRWRDGSELHQLKLRLFSPWILPRGTRMMGTVHSWEPERGVVIDLSVTMPEKGGLPALRGVRFSAQGWLPLNEIAIQEQVPAIGAQVPVEILGYSDRDVRKPSIILGGRRQQSQSFQTFAKSYAPKKEIDVEMAEVLEDPVGRSPVFIVRELATGLEIPMADTDFCGGTHPQAYFGRRFGVGEAPFKVTVREIAESTQQVFLSRGQQLLQEYAQIPYADHQRIEVVVTRVDSFGAYFAVKGAGHGSPYVGFVRRSLWPDDFHPQAGDSVLARFRRSDRHIKVDRLEQMLREGKLLPEDLDLGIELDLITPPAYERFANQESRGNLIDVYVDKALDSGGLLVTLAEGLKGIIYESELELDAVGRPRSARDYLHLPSNRLTARVYQMQPETFTVRCSLQRVQPLPGGLERGQEIGVRLLDVREDQRDANRLWLTCSLESRFQVVAEAVKSDAGSQFEIDDELTVIVERADYQVMQIRGRVKGAIR